MLILRSALLRIGLSHVLLVTLDVRSGRCFQCIEALPPSPLKHSRRPPDVCLCVADWRERYCIHCSALNCVQCTTAGRLHSLTLWSAAPLAISESSVEYWRIMGTRLILKIVFANCAQRASCFSRRLVGYLINLIDLYSPSFVRF